LPLAPVLESVAQGLLAGKVSKCYDGNMHDGSWCRAWLLREVCRIGARVDLHLAIRLQRHPHVGDKCLGDDLLAAVA
jgi:hypothetical protein